MQQSTGSFLQRSNRIPPSDLVVLRGLPASTEEGTVHQVITEYVGLPIEHVRLVRDKLTGICSSI